MRIFAGLLRTIPLAALLLGCGEEIDFASGRDAGSPMVPDVSVPTADAPRDSSVGARDASKDGGVDGAYGFHWPPDSGCPPQAFAAFACAANGALCRNGTDCCSGRCEGGYCLHEGTCTGPGSACDTRSGCCSQRCEPNTRTGALECGQYCLANGARCREASDCCSLGCNGGTCGFPICQTAGSPCNADGSCCSGRCAQTGCAETVANCLPSGEGCGQDGGMKCCSGVCNGKTGRCDLGQGGACREPSSPCTADSDCCRQHCVRNPQDPRGGSVCMAPCVADGQDCDSNGDCCAGSVCTGKPTLCETPTIGCP